MEKLKRNEIRNKLKEREQHLLKLVNEKNKVIDLSHETEIEDGNFIKADIYEKIFNNTKVRAYENIKIKLKKDLDKKHIKNCLENTASKYVQETKLQETFFLRLAIFFFVLGIILLFTTQIPFIYNIYILNQILIIISWVFIWTGVERIFFSNPMLKFKRIKHINISNADLIS